MLCPFDYVARAVPTYCSLLSRTSAVDPGEPGKLACLGSQMQFGCASGDALYGIDLLCPYHNTMSALHSDT